MGSLTDATTTSEKFEYPDDRLLELRDVIQEDQMHKPDIIDDDGKPCRFVIKNGNATGVTILQWQAAISDVSMTGNLCLPLLPQNTSIWDETGQKLIALIGRIYLVD
jgi:hypothetical protein